MTIFVVQIIYLQVLQSNNLMDGFTEMGCLKLTFISLYSSISQIFTQHLHITIDAFKEKSMKNLNGTL